MSFSEDEAAVLNHFFTNLEKPVFAAKNFHPEVWALMQARYSRETRGMREGFLELLKEDEKNFAELGCALSEGKEGLRVERASERAAKFMEKWVLGYGHSSVAEGATVGLGLEGVSILATKEVEDNRLSSFCEKSTRYVSFDENSFYEDERIRESKWGEKARELNRMLFRTYKELHEPVLDYVKEKAPIREGQNKSAWERSCAARRFDAVRYCLPASTKTSLGWTVNARELAHAVRKLKESPLKEFREIGEMARKEAEKILPSLLKHADPNEGAAKRNEEMRRRFTKMKSNGTERDGAKMVEGSEDAEERVLSAVLFRFSQMDYGEARKRVEGMNEDERAELIEEIMKRVGSHEALVREFENAGMLWEITVDYGAFRDIQRHRMCTQTNQLLTADLGYETPEDIVGAGCKGEFEEAMEEAKALFGEVREELPFEAQYLVPLAYRKRALFGMNLREAFCFIRLRSSPQGHYSYRRIARQMNEEIGKKWPAIARWFQCNCGEEELGRLGQETKREEKK